MVRRCVDACDSASEFRKHLPANYPTPKIQLVFLTHCAWLTDRNARNVPNQQTMIYLKMIKDLVSRNITHFTTDDPDNDTFLLDDFLGAGRISSALSKPILFLEAGVTMRVNRVNDSVDKCKNAA